MAKYVTVQVTRREPPPPVGGRRASSARSAATACRTGELEQNLHVCPHCGYHYPMPAHARVAQLADAGSVSFIAEELRPADPARVLRPASLPGAVRRGPAGDRADRGHAGRALQHLRAPGRAGRAWTSSSWAAPWARWWASASTVWRRRPSPSGRAAGGRGLFRAARACRKGCSRSCRWPRPSSAVQMVGEAGLPYITILTHPTTGGVFASFATVADIIMAEPGAVMQFAGSPDHRADHPGEASSGLRLVRECSWPTARSTWWSTAGAEGQAVAVPAVPRRG